MLEGAREDQPAREGQSFEPPNFRDRQETRDKGPGGHLPITYGLMFEEIHSTVGHDDVADSNRDYMRYV